MWNAESARLASNATAMDIGVERKLRVAGSVGQWQEVELPHRMPSIGWPRLEADNAPLPLERGRLGGSGCRAAGGFRPDNCQVFVSVRERHSSRSQRLGPATRGPARCSPDGQGWLHPTAHANSKSPILLELPTTIAIPCKPIMTRGLQSWWLALVLNINRDITPACTIYQSRAYGLPFLTHIVLIDYDSQ